MEALESKSYTLLLSMMEAASILRDRNNNIFSSRSFKFYQAYIWVGLSTLITSCCFYLLYEQGNKNMTIMMLTLTLQFLACHVILVYKKKDIQKMLHASLQVLYQLQPNDESRRKIDFVDEKSYRFLKSFVTIMNLNVFIGIMQALLKTWIFGRTGFPFDGSCLGLSTFPCWILQILMTTTIAIYIASYLTILKITMYQLRGYADILSDMIRDRPIDDDEKNDRAIFKLYCDFQQFATLFSNIFGATAFLEITFSTVRSCFQSYHVITAISNKDWANASGSILAFACCILVTYIVCSCGDDMDKMNQVIRNGALDSKWFESSPQSRKRFLFILALNDAPVKFHYRHYMSFDMEMLNQVLGSTYSLTTAMANIIDI